ncbi:MAG: hypothetical protein Q8N26_10310 [Myxococcales bacterium]|nr:hypothetical protein [Myxococcales bacterium]
MHTPPPSEVTQQLEELRRELEQLKRRSTRPRWVLPVVASLVVAGVALAQPALSTFQPDAPALAAEVNGNFTSVAAFTVPPGAVMLFDLAACPTGWSAFAEGTGRLLMGRPGAGTLRQTFGTALTGNGVPVHGHSTGVAGNHTHSGTTGNWVGYRASQINYNAVPGYGSSFHIISDLFINGAGDHTHSVSGTNASDVLPYVFLTPCRKN